MEKLVDGDRAMASVEYFTRFWRIGGGPGFDSCLNYIETNLVRLGFSEGTSKQSAARTFHVQEDVTAEQIWTPEDAILALEIPEQRVLHSFSQTPVMLCQNSFPAEVTAELVYVKGGGKPTDYDQVDVRGKVVLCDAPPGVYRLAMDRGAVGLVSSFVPKHNSPELHPDIIAESGIPYDDTRKPFALKTSPRTAAELQQMLRDQHISVRIFVKTSFKSAPIRTLVAEIAGAVKPDERIVLAAHLDHYKPGANDNASGSATLLEILRAISSGIQSGRLPQPARTLTFLWVDEYKGTSLWMKKHEALLKDVRAVFVLDMVGGDPKKTGGTFRVERMPDPAAIWFRPPEQHSGWGAGNWDKAKLFGSFLNDFYLSVVERRARATGWNITYNVWEGGSDHDPFLWKGIPAILSWHFPDFGYHSSMDVSENVSPIEMKHAGASIGTAALTLAAGTETAAWEILKNVALAAEARSMILSSQVKDALMEAEAGGATTLEPVRKQEREMLEAWRKWYDEALESVLTVPITPPTESLKNEVRRAVEDHRFRIDNLIAAMGL